jgi:hypothetical protein
LAEEVGVVSPTVHTFGKLHEWRNVQTWGSHCTICSWLV